jgi:1-acyl-sn-glycerol-3-phosphate acyltransferase
VVARLFAVWALFWSFLLGPIVGTLFVLPFAVLPRGRRERYAIHGASLFAWLVVRFILLVDVRRTGEVDIEADRGALLLCNHRSWLDPLLLLAYARANGLSKRSILYLPFIGVFGHLSGAVFFDRRNRADRARARAEVLRLVRGGNRLQVFPEGTRTIDGQLRRRVFLALPRDAWHDGIPVVPCAVEGTEKVLPVGRFAAHLGQSVELRVGSTLYPRDFQSEEDFAIAAWQAVKDLLGQAD